MKPDEPIDARIAALPFFDGLPPEYLRMFADCATVQPWTAGDFVLREGKPAQSFHILLDGGVLIQNNAGSRTIPIQSLGAGEVLGWSWMLPPYTWHFDAVATEPTETLTVDALCIRGKCEVDSRLECELYKRFSRLMVRRLLATRLQLVDAYQ